MTTPPPAPPPLPSSPSPLSCSPFPSPPQVGTLGREDARRRKEAEEAEQIVQRRAGVGGTHVAALQQEVGGPTPRCWDEGWEWRGEGGDDTPPTRKPETHLPTTCGTGYCSFLGTYVITNCMHTCGPLVTTHFILCYFAYF